MKHRYKRVLTLLLLISLASGAYLQAQESIYVEETNGVITQVPLTQVSKINFTGTDMILHKTDATTITWSTDNVQKYYYALSTNIDNLKITENNNVSIYPNPSNGEFTIDYQIKNQSKIEISLIDITGRIIDVILNEKKDSGNYTVHYRNTKILEGIYLIKINNNNNLITKRIIIK